jgi:hypothetical protein
LSTKYISVSLFGLYFTYLAGTLIIVVSFILEPILSCAQKRWKYKEYENLEWISNGTLQLQRLAYEGNGQGQWAKCTDNFPITAAGELFGSLDIVNLEHPRLGKKPEANNLAKEAASSPLMIQVPSQESGLELESATASTGSSVHQSSPGRHSAATQHNLTGDAVSEITTSPTLGQQRLSHSPNNREVSRESTEFPTERHT